VSSNEADSSQKKYYTIEEVEKLLGKSRATIYNRMKLIDVKTRKFKYDRKTYIAAADVERIRTVFEQPWIAEEADGKGGDNAA
jgi:hypothetical protein